MDKRYSEVQKRMKGIQFNELWPGFNPCRFALYNEEQVILDGQVLPWDERFIGNTAIDFEGETIAIWKFDSKSTLSDDQLASKIIHEMFHAFQKANRNMRWPNEFREGLTYEYSVVNLSMKVEENNVLCDLYESFDELKFKEFLLRRYRRQNYFKRKYIYEVGVEGVEGMAQFVELKALQQLDLEAFEEAVRSMLTYIRDYNHLIPMRTLCYHVGALLLLVCENNHKPMNKDVGLTFDSILNLVTEDEMEEMEYVFHRNKQVDVLIKNYYRDIIKKIERFIDSARHIDEGQFQITGLDPQNTILYKQHLYCKHFIAYRDQEVDHLMKHPCVLELNDQMMIEKIYY